MAKIKNPYDNSNQELSTTENHYALPQKQDKYNIKAIVIQDGKIIHMDNDVEASFH